MPCNNEEAERRQEKSDVAHNNKEAENLPLGWVNSPFSTLEESGSLSINSKAYVHPGKKTKANVVCIRIFPVITIGLKYAMHNPSPVLEMMIIYWTRFIGR
jgi:hypothetical protein